MQQLYLLSPASLSPLHSQPGYSSEDPATSHIGASSDPSVTPNPNDVSLSTTAAAVAAAVTAISANEHAETAKVASASARASAHVAVPPTSVVLAGEAEGENQQESGEMTQGHVSAVEVRSFVVLCHDPL